MHSPPSCQWEGEAICYYFCQSVGNGFGASLVDFHAGREGTDFEGVGAGEGIGGLEGHGLEDGLFEVSGGGVDGFGTRDVGECGLFGGIEVVEFGGKLF